MQRSHEYQPALAKREQVTEEQRTAAIAGALHAEIDGVITTYATAIARHGGGLDAVGGAQQVAQAVAGALPRPSRLAERLGPVYTTGQLTRLLPGPSGQAITDQAVRNRRDDRRLIAVKTADGRWAFPAFQFTARDGRLEPREEVIGLWRLLPLDGPFDAMTLAVWLTGPRRDLDGMTPLRWLEKRGLDGPLRRAAGRLRRRAAA